jgi:hypothetical protein
MRDERTIKLLGLQGSHVQTPLLISIIAVFISAISAAVTIFNIYRDRAKVISWSEIVYDMSQDPDDPPPVLYIKIVNTGLRPIILISIKKIAKNSSWGNALRYPDYDQLNVNASDAIRDPETRRSVFSIKNTSVVLKESEYFEVSYGIDDFQHEVRSFFNDELHEATSMQIEDVLGTKIKIKDIKKNIEAMYQYKPNKKINKD